MQPAPVFQPSAPSNSNLVLGQLIGSDRVVVRDITDVTHPKTLSTIDTSSIWARFVSATDVSYVNQDGTLVRVAFSSSSRTAVATCAGAAHDWNADGTVVVYTNQTDSGASLHQLTGGRDVALASLPKASPVGCESQSCADGWDSRLLYSPDGAYISLVRNIGVLEFRIWSSDGKLVKVIDSQTTMSAWSGKSLYFRDDKGVEVWRDGVVSSFLPGVAWIRPKASPAGGRIIYEARDSAGLAHTYIVDTVSAKVRDLGKGRSDPAFLTSTLIWYAGERMCTSSDPCPIAPTIASGKTYIYDLQDSTETESRITRVFDVWPHPA